MASQPSSDQNHKQQPPQLWSSIARDPSYTGGARTFANSQPPAPKPQHPKPNHRPRRARSPSHAPQTAQAQEEQVYVLTLQTDAAHHARMTALRNKHFPRRLNRLEAHLTLFHALPASKLASAVLPTLRRVAAGTEPFDIHASEPFRLKKGVSVGVARARGGEAAGEVRRRLLESWRGEGWLSEQDARPGGRVHYTVMNKVEEEGEVERCLGEVRGVLGGGDWGRCVGLGLWRYERGGWVWEKGFAFGEGRGDEEGGGK